MRPFSRKLLLTGHVVVSLGWLGAATAILALGVAALSTQRSPEAMYGATELVWLWVVVPFSLAAWGSGVAQALGTGWGLLRHYWVIAKLLITTAALLLLLLHTRSLLSALTLAEGDALMNGTSPGHGGWSPQVHLVVAAAGTLLLLLVNTALSVFKPWGSRGGRGRARPERSGER